MKRPRSILALGLALALLAPVMALALPCQTHAGNAMAAMACCRQMHSACMRGEHAGGMACCQQVAAPQPPALVASAAAITAPTPAVVAVVCASLAPPRLARRAPARAPGAAPPPAPPPLHAILLI